MCVLRSGFWFLLLKRKKNPHQGKITPIGGKLEPHEDPHTAAVRETKEETGLDIPAYRYIGSLVETSPTNYNWNCLIYVAEIPYQTPPPCDEGELLWVHQKDLLKVPTPVTDWHIYDYLLRNRPFMFTATFDADLQLLSMREEIEGRDLLEA